MDKHKKQMYATLPIVLLASIALAFLFNARLSSYATAEGSQATKEQALDALLQSEGTMKEMADRGLGIKFINDTLLVAKRHFIGSDKSALEYDISTAIGTKKAYLKSLLSIAEHTSPSEIEKLDYAETIKLTEAIESRKKQAYALLDTISILEQREKEYRTNNANTTYAKSLIDEGKQEFDAERYNNAENSLKQADIELDIALSENKRIKEIVELSKTFLSKYWSILIIMILTIAAASMPAAKKIRKYRAKKRLILLKAELGSITQSVKKAQEDYLKNKKISKSTYESIVGKLTERSTKIKHTIPVLESIASDKKDKERNTGILEVKP